MREPAAPMLHLRSGVLMPQLGLGTSPMSSREVEPAIVAAVEAGYRLFDTAYAYGNEEGVGAGVRACGIPREQLFITSKLNGPWHGYEGVQEAWAGSVERLGFDYVDLFLIHWPLPAQDRYVDAVRGLAKLLEDGRIRAFGVSNFKPAHLDRVLRETGLVPDVNQIHLNPYLTRDELRAYHTAHGILTQSYNPLGGGGEVLAEPVIVATAERHDKTPAQVILRWHMQLGLAAVPRSQQPERMRQNIDVFDWTLTDAEVAAIAALDRGEGAVAWDSDVKGH
ncbi:MAG: aldo/keto reductase [Solirubrobacteraceae bacterium]